MKYKIVKCHMTAPTVKDFEKNRRAILLMVHENNMALLYVPPPHQKNIKNIDYYPFITLARKLDDNSYSDIGITSDSFFGNLESSKDAQMMIDLFDLSAALDKFHEMDVFE